MPKKQKKGKTDKKDKREKKEKKEKKEKLAKRIHSGGSDSDSSDSSSSAEGRKRKRDKKEKRAKEKRHKEKKKRKREDDDDSGSSSSSSGGDGVQRSVITGRKLKLQRDDKNDAGDARRAAIRAQMNEGETFEWGGGAKGKPLSAYERKVAELKADPGQVDALMRKKAEQARLDLAVGFGNKPAGRGGYFPDRGRTV
jgi:hypothetical protein